MGLRQTIWLYLSLTAVILQSFTIPVVFMGFNLNRDYIAAELCVNRDVPESGCNGQCYLMKKLKQAQQDAQGTEKPNAKRDGIWQHCSGLAHRPTLLPLRETLRSPVVVMGYIVEIPLAVFHPPQYIVSVSAC